MASQCRFVSPQSYPLIISSNLTTKERFTVAHSSNQMSIPYLEEVEFPEISGYEFIYVLFDKAINMARYVGRTNNKAVRFSTHIKKAQSRLRESNFLPVLAGERCYNVEAWIAEQLSQQIYPRMLVVAVVPTSDAQRVEHVWMEELFKKGHPLLNYRGGWDKRWLNSKLK